jgi:serine/threonine protein kinase
MSGLVDPEAIEAAFADIITAGPAHALARFEEVAARRPELRGLLAAAVNGYLVRHRRTNMQSEGPLALMPPARFQVIKFLGSGGFGHVYHVIDTEAHGAEVAVKLLHSAQATALRRFKQEFDVLSSVADHANLVRLYNGVFDDPPWFFTMEFVDGVSLLAYLGQFGGDRYEHVRSCLGQLASAVDMLHRHAWHHRDLKPSNVLVTRDERVKVIDFGLAHELDPGEDRPVSLVGTLEYMAPEQLMHGTISKASDWYAVGVMLYEALTGTRPYAHRRSVSGDGALLPPNRLASDVPDDLNALCVRLLAKDPRQRAAYEDLMAASTTTRAAVVFPSAESHFVGRDLERRKLMELFARSRSQPVVVHLSGPTGVGKSALIRKMLSDVHRRQPDAIIIPARCHQNRSVPYPMLDDLIDRLGKHLGSWPKERVDQVLPRNAAALTRMFPVLSSLVAALDNLPARESVELRRRGFASLAELLGRLSDRYTVVLSIDDAQWGDRSGLAFLQELMTSIDAPHLMLVLSYREDGGDLASLLREAPGDSRFHERVSLQPLSDDDSRVLVRALLGDSVTPIEQSVRIVETSGGIPYLIEEVAQWASQHRGDNDRLATITPEEVLAERIDALGPNSRRLLELVAVAGQPTAVDELVHASRVSNVLEAVDELRRRRLTQSRRREDRDEVEVYHTHVREAILARLRPEEHQERHRQMAEALQLTLIPNAERIASHFDRAGDPDRCLLFARRAGDDAFRSLAFEKAAYFYQMAVATGRLGTDDRRTTLTSLAVAMANAGRCADAASYYAEAARLAEPDEQMVLVARAADQLLRAGYIREGLRALDDVMSRLHVRPPRARWALLVRLGYLRARLAMRGLKIRRRHGPLTTEERLRLEVCWTGAMVTSLIDPLRSAESSTRYVLLALRSGDSGHVATALSCEAPLLCFSRSRRSHARAHALLDTVDRLATATGEPHARARYLLSRALVAFLQGRWRAAAEEADQAEEHLRSGCVNVTWEMASSQIFACSSRYIQGDWSENHRRLPDIIRQAEQRGESNVAVSLRVQGCLYLSLLAADQPEAAVNQLRQDVASWPYGHADFFRCNALQAEVDVALYRNDAGQSQEVIERDWRALERALLLRNPTTFAFLHFARGRAALAMAGRERGSARHKTFLDSADASAAALLRKGPDWSAGMALLLRAGVASWSGSRDSVDKYLVPAEQAFSRDDMQPMRMAALSRMATPPPGSREAIDQWVRRAGVARFDRVCAALAPGNYGSSD